MLLRRNLYFLVVDMHFLALLVPLLGVYVAVVQTSPYPARSPEQICVRDVTNSRLDIGDSCFELEALSPNESLHESRVHYGVGIDESEIDSPNSTKKTSISKFPYSVESGLSPTESGDSTESLKERAYHFPYEVAFEDWRGNLPAPNIELPPLPPGIPSELPFVRYGELHVPPPRLKDIGWDGLDGIKSAAFEDVVISNVIGQAAAFIFCEHQGHSVITGIRFALDNPAPINEATTRIRRQDRVKEVYVIVPNTEGASEWGAELARRIAGKIRPIEALTLQLYNYTPIGPQVNQVWAHDFTANHDNTEVDSHKRLVNIPQQNVARRTISSENSNVMNVLIARADQPPPARETVSPSAPLTPAPPSTPKIRFPHFTAQMDTAFLSIRSPKDASYTKPRLLSHDIGRHGLDGVVSSHLLDVVVWNIAGQGVVFIWCINDLSPYLNTFLIAARFKLNEEWAVDEAVRLATQPGLKVVRIEFRVPDAEHIVAGFGFPLMLEFKRLFPQVLPEQRIYKHRPNNEGRLPLHRMTATVYGRPEVVVDVEWVRLDVLEYDRPNRGIRLYIGGV